MTKKCCGCGTDVVHESTPHDERPEAEYHDGDPYCPNCWNYKLNKPKVNLMPKTLEQLDDAIKEAESQCIVSVVSFAVSEIVEHRLVSSEQSSEVLAELCRKYTLIEDDDVEIVQSEGYYSDDSYHISAIHLDAHGRYDQSPGEE